MGFDISSIGKQVKGASGSNSTLKVMTVAGALGGLAGFVLSEYIQGGDTSRFFEESAYLSTGVWFALVLVGIGLALSASQGITEKNPEKAKINLLTSLPALVIGGLIAGVVAQNVYTKILGEDGNGSQRLARSIGWAVAGGLGGFAVGVGFRSKVRMRNGALGGLGGGFIGGLLFDSLSTGTQSRFFGILIIGTLVGVFFALLDAVSTDYFLEVVSGETRGLQFVLFDQSSIIGCARNIAVTLVKDPLIAEQHVKATKNANGLAIECLRNSVPVLINGQQIQNGILPVGGTIQIGNTVLLLGRKKSGGMNTSGASFQVISQNLSTNQPAKPVTQSAPVVEPTPARARPSIQMPNKPKR